MGMIFSLNDDDKLDHRNVFVFNNVRLSGLEFMFQTVVKRLFTVKDTKNDKYVNLWYVNNRFVQLYQSFAVL